MSAEQFVEKWQRISVKERSAAQTHFNELCDLLAVDKPLDVDPEGEFCSACSPRTPACCPTASSLRSSRAPATIRNGRSSIYRCYSRPCHQVVRCCCRTCRTSTAGYSKAERRWS